MKAIERMKALLDTLEHVQGPDSQYAADCRLGLQTITALRAQNAELRAALESAVEVIRQHEMSDPLKWLTATERAKMWSIY